MSTEIETPETGVSGSGVLRACGCKAQGGRQRIVDGHEHHVHGTAPVRNAPRHPSFVIKHAVVYLHAFGQQFAEIGRHDAAAAWTREVFVGFLPDVGHFRVAPQLRKHSRYFLVRCQKRG